MPDSRNLTGGEVRPVPEEEQNIVTGILAGFEQARLLRYNFELQWNETALLCLPEWANTFSYLGYRSPGMKHTYQQLDSSLSIASHRFSAIADSLCTPFQEVWSVMRHEDDYLMKQRGVKEYYDDLTRAVHNNRYKWCSGFRGQNSINWLQLGVFGNQNMFIDELAGGPFGDERGTRYKAVPIGEMYYLENHQGVIDSYFRAFKWDARRIKQRFPDTFPDALKPALEQRSSSPFWVIQFVCPRTDWQPWRLDAKGKRWASYYVSLEGRCILEEGGYRTFPMAVGRYLVAPDEVFGRGPAQIILATGKTLNAEKGTFLTQGHRAGNPIYLTADDGMMSTDFYPGAVIGGGMGSDGRAKVSILPTGNIQITKEMMDVDKEIVEDAFLVSLFRLAIKSEDQPQLSPRQVLEQLEQKGMLIGPTLGRQLDEYCGGIVYRELDVLSYQGQLPKVHPAVKEAGGSLYKLKLSNPITRMLNASKAAGFMKMVEMTGVVAQSSGDESVWDNYEFDVALPEMADDQNVPVRWIADAGSLARKRKNREQEAQRDAEVKAMPAKAAIIKAQAIGAKAAAGQNIGGTLSGTAPGQMPLVPNSRGRPGQPGMGGGPGVPGQPG